MHFSGTYPKLGILSKYDRMMLTALTYNCGLDFNFLVPESCSHVICNFSGDEGFKLTQKKPAQFEQIR
jgi:hypothetical protein